MNLSNHQLDQVFHALSDSTRRAILVNIGTNGESVNNIASRFDISLPAVSKHLNVLERSGLIRRSKKGRQRICFVEPSLLENANEWLSFYQQFWDQQLDSLTQYLEQENHHHEDNDHE